MKFCGKCKTHKELSEFGKKSSNTDGLQHMCLICKRNYDNNYFKNSTREQKDNKLKLSNKIKKDNRITISDFKLSKGCFDCGYNTNPAALQFDHLSNKRYNVSDMISNGLGIELIMKEIDKCVVRCANCHSIKTAKDQGWY